MTEAGATPATRTTGTQPSAPARPITLPVSSLDAGTTQENTSMNTTTPVTTPEGQYVTVWTEPRKGYPGMFTVRTTAEGGALIKRDGLVQFCHVRGSDRAIAEHKNQVAIAKTPEDTAV